MILTKSPLCDSKIFTGTLGPTKSDISIAKSHHLDIVNGTFEFSEPFQEELLHLVTPYLKNNDYNFKKISKKNVTFTEKQNTILNTYFLLFLFKLYLFPLVKRFLLPGKCLLRSEIETEVNHNHYLATLKSIVHCIDLAPSNTYGKLIPSLAFKTGMQKFSRQDLLSQKAEPQKL